MVVFSMSSESLLPLSVEPHCAKRAEVLTIPALPVDVSIGTSTVFESRYP